MLYFLVCDPPAAVFNINDPAAPETIFLQHILHDNIILMSIDLQIAAL